MNFTHNSTGAPYVTHATNGIKFTQLERQQLKRIRYEGHDDTTPQEVTAA